MNKFLKILKPHRVAIWSNNYNNRLGILYLNNERDYILVVENKKGIYQCKMVRTDTVHKETAIQ